MSSDDRAVHTLGHLALAFSGACLTAAEMPYLPELPLLLLAYLMALAGSWWSAGRHALSNRAANALGLLIVAATTGWVLLRLQAPTEGVLWFEDLALHALLVPFLGPVVMALLAVRMFQPRTPGDFWVVQGLGLLQVALGCVLAGDTMFGPLLLAYLVLALCALAARERQAQRRRSAAAAPAEARRIWALFGLRWGAAAAALAVPMFLVTPRHDGPEWQPFDRFLARPHRDEKSRTGFSTEIDLNHGGLLEPDDAPAFTVRVTDAAGRPVEALPAETRWRGAVLDNYEDGVWRTDLTWPGNGTMSRTAIAPPPAGPSWTITFKVPSRAGGLFLADPILLGPQPGQVPVRSLMRQGSLFFESGSTAVGLAYLTQNEYRYAQTVPAAPRDRAAAVRLRNGYALRLIQPRVPGLAEWGTGLLRRLAARRGERELLAELGRPREAWEGLAPEHWETVGRLYRDHLAGSGEYTYSLYRERARPDLDPVLDFLAHTKSGHCERFAAALALLLRSQGVPARLVKGYLGADATGEGNYVVRQSHAHAWVEAAVPARGEGPLAFDWLALDPTPPGDGDGSRSALARWWQQQQRSGRELWEELIVGYNSSQQASLREELASGRLALAALPWLALAAGAFVLVALARHGRRRWWRPRGAGAASLYERLCEVLGGAGLSPAPGETPAELARRAEAQLAGREATAAVAAVPRGVVELYYRARYAGAAPAPAELAEAGEGLARLGRALA